MSNYRLCQSLFALEMFPDFDHEDDDDSMMKFKQWESTDRMDLNSLELPLLQFIHYVVDQLYKLIPHSYIAREQSKYIKDKKESMEIGHVLCNMDFSQNHNFIIQNEVQGYHWTNKTCTVHPVVCYYKKNQAQEITKQFIPRSVSYQLKMIMVYQWYTQFKKG